MARTVQQQIDIGNASAIYDANVLQNGSLHGGLNDIGLPLMIFAVRQGLEWLYELDPADEDLDSLGNYLISICKNAPRAEANIVGGGGTPTIINPSAFSYPLRLTGADFEVDGVTYNNSNIVGDNLMLFVSNFNEEWQFAPTFFNYTATGIVIVFPGFDANDYDQIIIQQYFNP